MKDQDLLRHAKGRILRFCKAQSKGRGDLPQQFKAWSVAIKNIESVPHLKQAWEAIVDTCHQNGITPARGVFPEKKPLFNFLKHSK